MIGGDAETDRQRPLCSCPVFCSFAKASARVAFVVSASVCLSVVRVSLSLSLSLSRAKKRDASTDLLRQHNVDFLGSDFNMSAFSTVGDVFSDPEFSAPGNSFLWGLGALEEQNRECTEFLIMPKRPYQWRVDTQGCCKYDNASLGFGLPRSNRSPSFISVPPTCLAPTASCAAKMPNKEKWNAGITNMTVREEDVLDCDVAHHSHVSAFLVTPSEFARESLACQLCLPTALTLGRFASSLCLCLCLCLSVCVGALVRS